MVEQKDSMENLLSGLSNLLSTKTVIGEPITLGDVTLVPIVDVMFGFGGGSGEGPQSGQAASGKGAPGGTGGGGGGRVAPKALIMVKGDEVSVLPLARGGTIERIIETLPEVVGKLSSLKGEKGDKEKTEDTK